MAKAKPIPEGYHNVTPYLVVKGAAAAIDFYKHVFGAVEIMRMPQPDGRVGHAEGDEANPRRNCHGRSLSSGLADLRFGPAPLLDLERSNWSREAAMRLPLVLTTFEQKARNP